MIYRAEGGSQTYISYNFTDHPIISLISPLVIYLIVRGSPQNRLYAPTVILTVSKSKNHHLKCRVRAYVCYEINILDWKEFFVSNIMILGSI